MTEDEKYMQRALELARLGLGRVSPNPMVGCVIVHRGKIIGEGWHQIYGGAHAEVNAVDAVADKSLLPESDVYVSLEPCAHHGKTPPCANLLARHKVKRTIICNVDVNPLVSGRGIDVLKRAGIEVLDGILAEEGRRVNKRFFTFHQKHRPYIILKWAETADGFIARQNYDSKWISNEYSRKVVHKWRAEEDAIMVGPNTGHYDNPRLNVRGWSGKNPVRVAVDRNLRLSPDLHLFDQKQPTLVYNLKKEEARKNLAYVKLEPEEFFQNLFKDLCSRNIQSVIVEGGAALLNELIRLNLWDEARVFYSEKVFNAGILAPALKQKPEDSLEIMGDRLAFYKNEQNG